MTSKKRTGKKARKPRALTSPGLFGPVTVAEVKEEGGEDVCWTKSRFWDANEARRLASWLLKFADWAEEGKSK